MKYMVFQAYDVLFFSHVCQVTRRVDDCNSERFQKMMMMMMMML